MAKTLTSKQFWILNYDETPPPLDATSPPLHSHPFSGLYEAGGEVHPHHLRENGSNKGLAGVSEYL